MTAAKPFLHVVGARPNFMKLAPVYRALNARATAQIVVHTGQHYAANMSGVFFEQLGLPDPDENLAIRPGTHTQQIAAIMMRFEETVSKYKPEVVITYGDVNSTMAAALVCAKAGIRVVHVEAGLRSFDRSMPEEINRVITDQLSDLLLTPSRDANENLVREGISSERIELVGNVMMDSVVRLLPNALTVVGEDLPRRFGLVTLHRPSNVSDPGTLKLIMDTLEQCSRDVDIIFPVHPRTRECLCRIGLHENRGNLQLIDPLPYINFLGLQARAKFVITDSGGVQEETTYLGVPCLTIRNNTERPVTVEWGTNILIGSDMELLKREVTRILAGNAKTGIVPELWDGKAGERIADCVLERYQSISKDDLALQRDRPPLYD